jgi:glycosyltransferase involved in cell wall biosynthesis
VTVKRLILVEPGLMRAIGHEQAHARVLAAECAKRGVAFHVLANKKAEDCVVSDLAAQRAFEISVYSTAKPTGPLDILKIRAAWSRRYREDFGGALNPAGVNRRDFVLLNTVTISVLDGYASWLASRLPEERPATAVILRLGAEEGLPGRHYPRLSKWLYRRSILKLSGYLNGRLFLASDTSAIGSEFKRLTHREVASIPLPILVPEATPPRPQAWSRSVVFPSSARAQKGFSLLPEALRLAMQRRPDMRATIRVADAPKSAAPVIDQLQAMAPQVRLIQGALPADRYYQMLSAADGILLPYDPVVFAKRSSQILAEAAALGRPVIVIAGSFLDRECQRAGIAAVAAEAFTGAALGAALQRFAADRDLLANAAWASYRLHRHRHSASAFMNQLLSFTRSCEAATSAR